MLSTCEVYLDNVEVEESHMVGEEGMGFLNVMYNFEMERLINAAAAPALPNAPLKMPPLRNQRIALVSPLVTTR